MISLCYASGDFVCPGTATEARLDGSEELNALANLSTFFWLSYQLLFFVFTSIFPIISFHSFKDATTRALIVKCDGQRVQHKCRCRCIPVVDLSRIVRKMSYTFRINLDNKETDLSRYIRSDNVEMLTISNYHTE